MEQEFGVGDGDRTRDIRCHRPTLYQLSYAHQWLTTNSLRYFFHAQKSSARANHITLTHSVPKSRSADSPSKLGPVNSDMMRQTIVKLLNKEPSTELVLKTRRFADSLNHSICQGIKTRGLAHGSTHE